MKIIPLNSLVIAVDCDKEEIERTFDESEIVNFEKLKKFLFGDQSRSDFDRIVMSEMFRLINTKLTFGQRVVVVFDQGRDKTRSNLARQIQEKGFTVVYYSDSSNKQELLKTDNISIYVDSDKPFRIINQIGDNSFFEEIKERGFNGITVIADIHGMYDAYTDTVALARSRNNYILFLGDLIDYGIDSIEIVHSVYSIVTRGQGEVLLGNHEMKIFRYLTTSHEERNRIMISEGNKATLNRLNELGPFDYTRWTNRFKSLVNLSRTHRTDGHYAFAHAAIDGEIWNCTDMRVRKSLEARLMYGEHSGEINHDGYPSRTYGWTEDIPEKHTVVVGHDIRSMNEPYTYKNSKGGTTIFLDTGCGKGGHLTSLDIDLTTDEPKLGMFFLH